MAWTSFVTRTLLNSLLFNFSSMPLHFPDNEDLFPPNSTLWLLSQFPREGLRSRTFVSCCDTLPVQIGLFRRSRPTAQAQWYFYFQRCLFWHISQNSSLAWLSFSLYFLQTLSEGTYFYMKICYNLFIAELVFQFCFLSAGLDMCFFLHLCHSSLLWGTMYSLSKKLA